MPRKVFSKKLLQRLKKVDQEQLERLFSRLVEEKDLIELVFSTVTEGILVTEASHRVLLTNVAFRSLLDLGEDPVVGKPVSEIIQDEALLEVLTRQISQSPDAEVRIEKPHERWMEVKTFPLWEDSGVLMGTLHVLRDVTERVHRQTTSSREQRLASLGALAAGLAHEIRNPLNALSIHAQLAQREVASGRELRKDVLSKELDIVSKAVETLETIVRQFLNAARPRRLDRRARDIHQVIDNNLTFLKPELDEAGIALKTEYDPNVPPLMVDAVQIQEVVTNLVKNAIEAMPDGGTLQIQTSMGKDAIIRIEFEDSGMGIPDEIISRVFDPYFTTKEEGTGLGLFLVHKIVTDHCGMIEVDSTVGRGTTISILLPRSLCEARFLPGW